MDTNSINQIFRDRGIKSTCQRIAVYKYLVENHCHPDVETVYSNVVRDNPSFSKTTVYNCLQVLAECGLIVPITIDSEKIRYDADTSFHGHFKCDKCGNIYDFECGDFAAEALGDFEIRQKNVYYNGVCNHCR